MSNSYFRFKQFTIEQDKCAMKVTTDACIQGAWTPVDRSVHRVLDIGAGTGLLALMLAQRSEEITIDAVEYDIAAAEQAKENAASSPWKERINIIHADIKEFQPATKYDLIITNPPFFNNSLLGDNVAKNRARHTTSLSYEDLLAAIDTHLAPDGYVSILLPTPEYLVWKELATRSGWHEQRKLSISHKPAAKVNRVVSIMARNPVGQTAEEELVIYEDEGSYSEDFKSLLSPFYLNL
jgi:tRNA1Val (adenine37-N6)-methyltransferase